MLKKLIALIISLMAITGCERELNLRIRYDQIDGLKQEDIVIFEGNQIGAVKAVTYTQDGDYIVAVSIKKEFVNAATEYSKFFISTDPQDSGKKAVEMVQTQQGGTLLQENALIEGSTRGSAFLNTLRDKFGQGIEGFKKEFDKFLEGLKTVPETEDFKKFENELNNLADEMRESGEAVRERLQKEVLPKLREELEMLRKRLREFGREDEVKPLEKKMDEMKKI